MRKIVLGVLAVVIGLFGWWWIERPVKVVRVVDGDNIELADGRRIRYLGIDSPEEGECFRDESTRMNKELVLNKKVKLKFDKDSMDNYGRILAYVYVDTKMVNQELLERGAGKYFFDKQTTRFEAELVAAAQQGYESKQGLWGECGDETGCVVKGNLDKLDKRWYHLPEMRHYNQVVVNLDKGDRWFCSQEEAVKAGFSKARQ